MCVVDFGEGTKTWTHDVLIARVLHICDCCGGAIRPRTPYTKHFSVSRDGDVCDEKMCGPCSLLMERFGAAHRFRWTNPSYLRELIHECANDYDKDSKRWKLEILNMDRRRRARERHI